MKVRTEKLSHKIADKKGDEGEGEGKGEDVEHERRTCPPRVR